MRGHVPLGDLEDAGIELPVDSDAYNSIGGYVFCELGRLPKRGDTIRANGYELRVESVRENRIVALRIHPVPPSTRALRAESTPRSRAATPVAGGFARSAASVRAAAPSLPRQSVRD